MALFAAFSLVNLGLRELTAVGNEPRDLPSLSGMEKGSMKAGRTMMEAERVWKSRTAIMRTVLASGLLRLAVFASPCLKGDN